MPIPVSPREAADAVGAPPPARLLSAAEVAEHLGISRAHVYNLLHRGLPSIKVGRCRRFRLADVDAFLAAGAAGGGAA